MNLLTRVERSLGWISIENLPVYIVTSQAILAVWILLNPGAEELLRLDPVLIRNGEYWRLLTFLFMSPFGNPLITFFFLYFQYICGTTLEEEWGSFPLTVFYLVGAIGAIAAAFVVGEDLRGAFYLNETIFLAFAALYPEFKILLFFVIPIKIKWIAWFTWAHIAIGFIFSPMQYRLAILISLLNYFLFFSKTHYVQVREFVQRMRHRYKYKEWND